MQLLPRVSGPAIVVIVSLAAAGCGAGGSGSSSSAARARSHPRNAQKQAPAPEGAPAPAADVQVIEGWAGALRRGDVRAAARYFRLPSVFAAGSGPPIAIHNLAQAEAANESLPCGAKLISAHRFAGDVNALFRLTERPGPGGEACGSGTGYTARTNFVIRRGRIVAWVRAPDQPGDNPGPPQTSTSSSGAPQV